MKQLLRNIVPLSIVGFLSTEVLAHPGHGHGGPAHYITEPEHSIVLVTAIAVMVLGVVFATRRSKRALAKRTTA